MKNRKRNQKGFSLIELLVVVAIILIVAAIAIPNLLQARVAANESSAVASLRTINTAMITYNSSYPTVGFAPTLTALGGTNCDSPDETGSCLIDTLLAAGTKSGYTFNSTGIGHRYRTRQPILCRRITYLWQRQPQFLLYRRWRNPLRSDRRRHPRSRFLHRPNTAPVITFR